MSAFPKAIQAKVDAAVKQMQRRLEQSLRGYDVHMTVAEWLSCQNISDAEILAYPNARTAYDIRNSPLGKALE